MDTIAKDKLIRDIDNTSSAIRDDREKGIDTESLEGYLKYLVNQL